MEILWLLMVAVMITTYVVLDGFDLGAGAVHLLVASKDVERRSVIRSIGPVWDGNEVWLVAGSGTLYFVFPQLYASSFSGFYLPLMIVLWLLILRGVSIELRSHVDSALWKPFWDVVFAGASGLLAFFFGAVLGNVVRGVPLEESGYFFLPLWTDLGLGACGVHGIEVGALDWYTLLVGLLALLTLSHHGTRWLVLKTLGTVNERSDRLSKFLWWGIVLLVALATIATFLIQPQVPANFLAAPWGLVLPLMAVGGLLASRWYAGRGEELGSFLGSCAFIVGMMTSAAFGIFPYVLPSSTDAEMGLTVYSAAAAPYGLKVGLAWFVPGIILAMVYFVHTYRSFAGKVDLGEEGY